MADFYSTQKLAVRTNATCRSLVSAFFLLGGLMFASSVNAQDNPPSFIGGSTQNLSTCYNASSVSINSYLTISDLDAGQTETWSVVSGPVNGTLAGFDATATSTGSNVTPSGLSYTPALGYTGADSFTIQVSDGIDVATTTIYVVTYPLPALSSTLTPAAICSGSTFSYTPASYSSGATFTWNRLFNGGFSPASSSGTGSISETLNNVTYYDVSATYAITTTAHGCSSTQNIAVTVHATPRLTSSLFDTTCTGGTFTYVPVVGSSGTTYSWSRASVAGITPVASSGTGTISETLTSTDTTAVNVVYVFTLNNGGCTATRDLTVTVVPQPPITSITTAAPAIVCSGTMFQNFGASVPPPAGASYVWSASNANIVAVGNSGQYCIVSFPNAGDASVMLNVVMSGAHCAGNGTYAVNVGPGASAPGASILYYNYQFIYQDNTQDSYQWGYDNVATLDSTLIPGAVFQSLPFTGTPPDFVNNYYWVITTKGGCMQKTYYNGPTSVPNVNAATGFVINAYPNPANNTLNVKVDAGNGVATNVAIMNMLGQAIRTSTTSGQEVQFDIADLPAGCYFVSCSQNGLKMATAKFIKN